MISSGFQPGRWNTLHHALRRCCATIPTRKDPKPTALAKYLYQHIRFSGPITVADYMRLCLTHPQHGYYSTHPAIFGASGDFITAPHITPVFSELLAVWIANHVTTKSLYNFELIELGPGTARLLHDLLPALHKLRASPASLTLFEASPKLQQQQKQSLSSIPNVPITRWADTLSNALDGNSERPVIVLAHEFFDALPVHILHKVPSQLGKGPQWRERLVDIREECGPEQPQFRFVLGPVATPASALAKSLESSSKGNSEPPAIEVSAESISTARRVAELIQKRRGAALIVDYGADSIRTETFRALSKHAVSEVLARPGECDVTADVNFNHLRHGVSGVPSMRLWGCVTQRDFLLRLGAAERFRVIARSVIASEESDKQMDEKLLQLQQDYDRIVGVQDGGMGSAYKVAAISNETDGVPFGF